MMNLRKENLTLRWISYLIVLSLLVYLPTPVYSSTKSIIHKWDNNFIRAGEDGTERPNSDESDDDGIPKISYGDECLSTISNSGEMTCCLRYTWTGHVFNPQLPSTDIPRNCSEIKLKDPNALCEGPLVWSYSNNTKRPNPRHVGEFCDANGQDCFCIGNACMTYVIYETFEGEPRRSEVHSCVPVRLQNDGSIVKNGCYREKINGSIREVCVCTDPFCNTSTNIFTSVWILFFTICISILSWVSSRTL